MRSKPTNRLRTRFLLLLCRSLSFVPMMYALVVDRIIIRYVKKLPTIIWYGVPIQLDVHDLIHRKVSGGQFERAERRFLQRALQHGRVAIDIGAHCGFLTIVMARSIGSSGVVHAYEPVPLNAAELCLNVQKFGKKVQVHQCAVVPSSESTVTLGRPNLWEVEEVRTSGNYSAGVSENALVVSAIEVNAILNGHEVVDLLKMDVEGLEPAIILNTSDANLSKIDYLMFELVLERDSPTDDQRNAIEKLRCIGFEVVRPLFWPKLRKSAIGLKFETIVRIFRLVAPIMKFIIGIDKTTVNFVAIRKPKAS
jgi:FkbM family methyltransferase